MSFSIAISVGPYGGFHASKSKNVKQVTLGWVSFQLWKPEIEKVVDELSTAAETGRFSRLDLD